MAELGARRRRRLAEELEESGLRLDGREGIGDLLLEEVDHALRPAVHERRAPSSGSFLDPRSDPSTWSVGTELEVARGQIGDLPLVAARRFADGRSSWLLRRPGGPDEWVVFNRAAGSERDLVVLAEVLDTTVVQRHPVTGVRIVGDFGVLRWDGFGWHHEPPVGTWIDLVSTYPKYGDRQVLQDLLEFAVHDLGAAGIGALLVYRPDDGPGPPVEQLLAKPPPLRIDRPSNLAPLRHALAQVDGAALFTADGTLDQLGVRLVPSADAEDEVDAYGGTRHTSGRRYSFDDPRATVIAVSEDGPVSVFRAGEVLGRSPEDES